MKNTDMRELKRKSKYVFFIVLISFLFISCSIFKGINKERYFKKGNKYCEVCNEKYSGQDTLKLEKNIICVFVDEKLSQVGYLENGEKIGVWYFYSTRSKSNELDMIVKYKSYQDSTWIWSRSMINQSW